MFSDSSPGALGAHSSPGVGTSALRWLRFPFDRSKGHAFGHTQNGDSDMLSNATRRSVKMHHALNSTALPAPAAQPAMDNRLAALRWFLSNWVAWPAKLAAYGHFWPAIF